MKVGTLRGSFEEWNKVKSKEEMLEELKQYRYILSKSMIEYFEGLIELDYSVIRDLLAEDDRKVLSDLDLYRDAFIYNVYNRTLNLFKSYVSDYDIKYMGNENGIEGLSFKVDGNNVFNFNYSSPRDNVPNGFRSLNIGEISLFKYEDNIESIKEDIDRVLDILDHLYNEKNPFGVPRKGIIGGPYAQWSIDHQSKINKYERLFEKLDSRGELTDKQKRQIEVTQRFHDLLLEDFGIRFSDFKEAEHYDFMATPLNKQYIKVMPGVTIVDNVKCF